jgi:hypothetical protein
MKVRRSIVAAGAVVVLGGAGAALPAVASASSATHTLQFISVMKKSVTFSKTSFGQQDTDTNAAGKTIGFDMLYFTVTSANSAAVNITGDFNGGFLYGTGTVSKSGPLRNGKVTGGTGAFKGATGTITTKGISATKTLVKVTYSG